MTAQTSRAMALLLAFLVRLRLVAPPWAQPEIAELEALVIALRGLPKSTVFAALAATSISLAAKAATVAALILLLGACLLREKTVSAPGVNQP